jgi:hypothetical protein
LQSSHRAHADRIIGIVLLIGIVKKNGIRWSTASRGQRGLVERYFEAFSNVSA